MSVPLHVWSFVFSDLAKAAYNAGALYSGAIDQPPVETTSASFESLGLDPWILDVITEIGFVHPTPIQVEVIPVAIEGRDVTGLAETGSGKTAAFGLPLVQHLEGGEGPRALILCPTREIALQTEAFLSIFGPPERGERGTRGSAGRAGGSRSQGLRCLRSISHRSMDVISQRCFEENQTTLPIARCSGTCR